MTDLLEPVRLALTAQARAAARAEVADAESWARTALAEARRRATAAVAAARTEVAEAARLAARADADDADRRLTRARLTARAEAHRRLRERVRETLRLRCSDPAVRERMAATIRSVLGEPARTGDAPGGGMLGTAGGRRLDLSVTALTDRAMDLTRAMEDPWQA
ncbi:hypothetical protein [Actinocatenispora thailandica]|uniref:hypothetical protein n=1 Tax=Actinocatenispora thailandica TaxID=227318 RepID=UPI0031DD9032